MLPSKTTPDEEGEQGQREDEEARVARDGARFALPPSATGVRAGEVVEEPCTLPVGVEPAPRRVLLDVGGLEIPVPTVLSVAGFLVGLLGHVLVH